MVVDILHLGLFLCVLLSYLLLLSRTPFQLVLGHCSVIAVVLFLAFIEDLIDIGIILIICKSCKSLLESSAAAAQRLGKHNACFVSTCLAVAHCRKNYGLAHVIGLYSTAAQICGSCLLRIALCIHPLLLCEIGVSRLTGHITLSGITALLRHIAALLRETLSGIAALLRNIALTGITALLGEALSGITALLWETLSGITALLRHITALLREALSGIAALLRYKTALHRLLRLLISSGISESIHIGLDIARLSICLTRLIVEELGISSIGMSYRRLGSCAGLGFKERIALIEIKSVGKVCGSSKICCLILFVACKNEFTVGNSDLALSVLIIELYELAQHLIRELYNAVISKADVQDLLCSILACKSAV